MVINITKDIKSVSDLKKRTREIFKQIHHTGRPIIVTVNGKPDVVLLDVEVFEKSLKSRNLETLLSKSEDDVKKGRVRSAHTFIKEFKRRAKV